MYKEMVEQKAASLDSSFAALADPTRRAILARLARGATTVMEIAEPFSISLPAISKHLKVLEQAGLLNRQKEGRSHYCHLNAEPLKEAVRWLTLYKSFWDDHLDSLATLLEEIKEEDNK